MLGGLALTALSFALLGPVPGLALPPASTPLILLALVLMGVGSCMVFVPALAAMMAVALERFGHVDGLEDVLSGLLNSSYYAGGGVMPMLGGALTESVGFARSCTLFGTILAAHFFVLRYGLRSFPAAAVAGRAGKADPVEGHGAREGVPVSSSAVHMGQRGSRIAATL